MRGRPFGSLLRDSVARDRVRREPGVPERRLLPGRPWKRQRLLQRTHRIQRMMPSPALLPAYSWAFGRLSLVRGMCHGAWLTVGLGLGWERGRVALGRRATTPCTRKAAARGRRPARTTSAAPSAPSASSAPTDSSRAPSATSAPTPGKQCHGNIRGRTQNWLHLGSFNSPHPPEVASNPGSHQ